MVRGALVCLLVPMAGLFLALSIRTLNFAGGRVANAHSERDATVSDVDPNVETLPEREEIRIAHNLPERSAANDEPISPPPAKSATASLVRGPASFVAQNKHRVGSVAVVAPPGDPLEAPTMPGALKGARPSSDGFDELVLPHP
jgi:hypothetical protein